MKRKAHNLSACFKVIDLYKEIKSNSKVRELVDKLAVDLKEPLAGSNGRLISALESENPPAVAFDIAHHLTDWSSEAKFLVAVQMFPELFTVEEIIQGVRKFICHAAEHIAEANRLVFNRNDNPYNTDNFITELCSSIREEIRNRIDSENFERWFQDISVLSISNYSVTLGVPSAEHKEYIESNYRGMLHSVREYVCQEPQKFTLVSMEVPSHD